MFCKNCGKILVDNARFCKYCGAEYKIRAEQRNDQSLYDSKKTPQLDKDKEKQVEQTGESWNTILNAIKIGPTEIFILILSAAVIYSLSNYWARWGLRPLVDSYTDFGKPVVFINALVCIAYILPRKLFKVIGLIAVLINVIIFMIYFLYRPDKNWHITLQFEFYLGLASSVICLILIVSGLFKSIVSKE